MHLMAGLSYFCISHWCLLQRSLLQMATHSLAARTSIRPWQIICCASLSASMD